MFSFMVHHQVRAVEDSLRSRPEEWDGSNHYRLRHSSGVAVWRENRPYGLNIEVKGSCVWGGVTALSSFGLSLSHHVLHHAIKQWERRNGHDVAELLSPKDTEQVKA